MNIFNPETWITFDGGVQVCFRAPTREEHVWATDALARVRAALRGEQSSDAEVARAILNEEIPEHLIEMAINAKLPGSVALPPDWKEQLAASSLLLGDGGLDVLQEACFRSRVVPKPKVAA